MIKTFKTIVTILFVSLSLQACVWPEQDGPPPGYVDVSKIPNAVPRHEPRSRRGNPLSYRVHGRRYYTLKSSKNFRQRGVASWYGTKFHAQKTSSGEPYNLYAMTAAHKRLPLPTFVRVNNLENGRSIVVRVNDRGPFAENRIIDLSYVGAKKLGMLRRGTALVEIEAIDPTHPHPDHHPALNPHPKLFIQIGAFSQRRAAEKTRRRLQAMIHHPIKITRQAHAGKTLYKVQIGPLATVAESDRLTYQLLRQGIKESFVVIT